MVVPGVLHLVDEPDADFAGTVRVAERVKVQLDFAHEVISGYDAVGDVVADLLPFVAVVGVFAFPVGVLAGERDGDVDFGRDCEPCALAGRVDCGVLVVALRGLVGECVEPVAVAEGVGAHWVSPWVVAA